MATQMLAAGVPIATVSQRLSHARASTTLNVYAHAIPGGDHHAAEPSPASWHPAERLPRRIRFGDCSAQHWAPQEPPGAR